VQTTAVALDRGNTVAGGGRVVSGGSEHGTILRTASEAMSRP
jgi:hypothetical protein